MLVIPTDKTLKLLITDKETYTEWGQEHVKKVEGCDFGQGQVTPC